ncbi:MAG: 3-isopropylmalate dehydratase small subunit, partial [Steroidobacteraceae bacterium]
IRNGIVPVTLSAAQIAEISDFVVADPAARLLEVDLEAQEVRADRSSYRYQLESEAREMLLEGLDGIDLTLKHRADIDAFVARDRVQRPWIYSTVEKVSA